tara:strand:+ start:252 stop:461 length:210 start_codon:yes stop_codon:yes gene_type:complete
MNKLSLFFIIFVLSGCSFDKSSNYWNYTKNDKIVSNNKIPIEDDIDFNQLKNKIIKFSKEVDFPDINKN